MSLLGDALFTTTQQRVLGLLYVQPGKSFYTKEILRLTGMGVATIKRELDRMVTAGILTLTKRGNQHHYQANPDCPIYNELRGVVNKTFGMADVVKSVLTPLADSIEWSFIFGSVASGTERVGSDIDLLVVGDVGFADLAGALYSSQGSLGREINPKIYRREEWIQMLTDKDAFVREILAKPRIDILGDGHGLR
ncbi:nucleotidyltransferase domain-containing protein [Sedimenticola sp.]